MTGFGIDLGTANTVVCHQRRGVVLDEPSVMVVRTSEARSRRVRPVLVGREARELMGRCPVGLTTVRPLHDGVIVDLEAARAFVVGVLAKMVTPGWQRVAPAGGDRRARRGHRPGAARRCWRWSTRPGSTARSWCRSRSPGQWGAGWTRWRHARTWSWTSVVVRRRSPRSATAGCSSHRSSRIAGDEMTLALYRYLRAEHQLLVGELTAEALKCRVDAEEGLSSVVQGIDLASGRPRLMTLESGEILDALRPTAEAIIAPSPERWTTCRRRRPTTSSPKGSRSSVAPACCAVSTSWSSQPSPSRCGWPSGPDVRGARARRAAWPTAAWCGPTRTPSSTPA